MGRDAMSLSFRRTVSGAIVLLLAGVVLLGGSWIKASRSPLSVGATADEAWTYIHSSTANQSDVGPFHITRQAWKAQALDIQCDVAYFFHGATNRLFANRHVVYVLNTNSVIVGSKSTWKWIWPF